MDKELYHYLDYQDDLDEGSPEDEILGEGLEEEESEGMDEEEDDEFSEE